MNHDTTDHETIMSLLHTIALIREAAGVDEKPMLSELPDAIRKIREERDEARREICNIVSGKQGKRDNFSPDAIEHATLREWDCFKTPAPKVVHTLKGVVSEVRKGAPPQYIQDLG